MAFKNQAILFGAGYYSQNFLNKTSQKDDGSSGVLGEANYLLNLKYDYKITQDWYLAPQLNYSLMPRSTPGNTSKVTITHLVFQIGKNFEGGHLGSTWDWYVGPGYLQYDIKGAGGTTVMNNGTSTATFAIPGSSSSTKKISTNLGASYTLERSRFGFDLIIENLLSSTKRTQDFMFSYNYQFGGDGF